jgi:hypothetical protein
VKIRAVVGDGQFEMAHEKVLRLSN